MKRKRNNKEWQELIAEQKRSGKTAVEFCRKHGIHPNVFYVKRKKLQSCSSFVKLTAISNQSATVKIKIKDVTIEAGIGCPEEELVKIIRAVREAVNAGI